MGGRSPTHAAILIHPFNPVNIIMQLQTFNPVITNLQSCKYKYNPAITNLQSCKNYKYNPAKITGKLLVYIYQILSMHLHRVIPNPFPGSLTHKTKHLPLTLIKLHSNQLQKYHYIFAIKFTSDRL